MKTAAKKTTVAPEKMIRGLVIHVPLDQLAPDPKQPRTIFAQDALDELAADIKVRGVEQPILIRSDGLQYLIKHGERRWRASQIAGKKDIPCLLAEPDDEQRPEIERLLDQATDNHHQRNLTPIEWGQLCKRLVEEHGFAVKDIPAELEKRGVKLSRPYISNLMRLTELPEWAQQLLIDNQITASDGKAILMARPYPKAMEWLKEKIEHEPLKEGQRVRDALFQYDYDDMEELVRGAYGETAIELTDTYGNKAPSFKWATSCKACPDRQQIDKEHFCLNATCFDAKQDKARTELKSKGKSEETVRKENRGEKPTPKKPAGPTTINPKKIDADGIVHVGGLDHTKYRFLWNARFEPAVHCAGCEFNKLARSSKHDQHPEPCCFNVPHFEELQRGSSREEGVAQWLDKRLLPEVLAKLPGNHELQFQLIAWMALRAPVQTENDVRVEARLGDEQVRTRRRLKISTPGEVFSRFRAAALPTEDIAAAGVRALLADRGHFYAFARHLSVKLTPAIAHLDEDYVALKRKGELITLIRGVYPDDWNSDRLALLDKQKLDDLVALALTNEIIQRVGVPPDAKALYEHLSPKLETDHDDLEEIEEIESDEDTNDEEDTNVDPD